MSSAVQGERWQATTAAWATRLIPGSGHSRSGRKSPLSVDDEGRARPVPQAENSPNGIAPSLGELVLPHPISVGGGWQLGVEVAGDAAATVATWALVAGVATGYGRGGMLRPTGETVTLVLRSVGFALVFAALVTLLGYSEGIYQDGLPRWGLRVEWTLAKAVAWAAVIAGVGGTLMGLRIVAWPWFVMGGLANFVALIGRRQWGIRQRVRSCELRPLNVLIAGAGHRGREVAHYLGEHPEHGRVVRGFLDDRGRREFGILGGVSDLARVARSEFADELIVIAPERAACGRGFVDRMVEEARALRLDVRIVPEVAGLGSEGRWVESWGQIPVVALHRENLPDAELVVKRAVDLAVAAAALVLAMPLMATIALLIAADSGLPLFYQAERVGRKGRRFRCAKFRTMTQDADAARERLRAINEREGPCFKIARDPRITRTGRLLRRYSLDELPQLWNVLRGDMSLVGPRPHPPDDFARYELEHFRRLDVTPGITGLWQVTARQDPSFDTNLALDLEYIERWSWWLDLQILWRTVGVVLRGTGA